jgi:hypothetical protein
MKKIMLIVLMVVMSAAVMASGIDNDTVLMLHNDGDASASQHTYTAHGNPTLVSDGKFGGAMEFDGSSYLSVPDSSDWDFRMFVCSRRVKK